MPRQPLICHRVSAAPAVRRIRAGAEWTGARLELGYQLEGDIARLRIPARRPMLRQDRLWQHSCFEAFVAVCGLPGYLEFNFAPSGEWAAYSFGKYREPGPLPELPQPEMQFHQDAERLELRATLQLAGLLPAGRRLCLALSAVIEDQDGGLSWWALRHPADRPDFHAPAGFILELAPWSGG